MPEYPTIIILKKMSDHYHLSFKIEQFFVYFLNPYIFSSIIKVPINYPLIIY